jgi:hypothetical protein
MRPKTLLKKLDEVLSLLKSSKPEDRQKAVLTLIQLRKTLSQKLEKEENKRENPAAAELAKWYYGLWEGKIPEGVYPRVVKTFKELLEEFKLPEEEIKNLYLWWLKLEKETVPKKLQKTYNIVLVDKEARSITDFKGKLRYIKALKRELESDSSLTGEWGETHDDDIYKLFFEKE